MDQRPPSADKDPPERDAESATKSMYAPDRRERPIAAALVWVLPRRRDGIPVAPERQSHRPRTCPRPRRVERDFEHE